MRATSVLDVSQYANVDSILNRTSVKSYPDYELLRSIAKLGHDHSKSGLSYSMELSNYVDGWELKVNHRQKRITKLNDAYTSYAIAAADRLCEDVCKRCRERERQFMKTTIPISYVIFGSIFLIASAVFITMFILGVNTGSFIITPWLNLSLCVASIGLTVTVIIATFEWRHRINGNTKKQKE